MATKKSSRATSKPAAKKKPAAAAKPAAKSKPSGTAAKVNTADIKVPAGREQKLAEQALKLVDEAAALLRLGIRTGASETAKSRIAAKKRATSLLNRATDNLTKAVESGGSTLKSVISKL